MRLVLQHHVLFWGMAILILLIVTPVSAQKKGPAKDEDEIVFDDENGEPTGEEEEMIVEEEKPAPVPQRVEQINDEQGLMRSMDEYDAHLPYEKMRKDIPRFHFDAAVGPAIGLGGLASHAGPAIRLSGLWRSWRYFAWGVALDAQFLMSKGVSRPGFAPALEGKFLIPLKRRHYLTPQNSWEIGIGFAAGYVNQSLMINNQKWQADGVHLRGALDFSYWYTSYMRLYGRVEFAAPFWLSLCEESAAVKHCETRDRFDGKTLAFLGGVGFVIW